MYCSNLSLSFYLTSCTLLKQLFEQSGCYNGTIGFQLGLALKLNFGRCCDYISLLKMVSQHEKHSQTTVWAYIICGDVAESMLLAVYFVFFVLKLWFEPNFK